MAMKTTNRPIVKLFLKVELLKFSFLVTGTVCLLGLLYSVCQMFPSDAKTFRDIGVVHLGISQSQSASLSLRPDHKRVHGAFHSATRLNNKRFIIRTLFNKIMFVRTRSLSNAFR